MAVLVFVTLGLFALTRLPIEMTPDISMEILSVMTTYPNVAPSEIESIVTDPIESAVSAVSGVDKIYSTSSEGSSMVMVQFTSGTDIDEAAQSVKDKIGFLKLPDDCNDPQVMKFDMGMMPIAQLSFVRDGYSLEDTQKFLEDNIQNQLEAIDGGDQHHGTPDKAGQPEGEVDVPIAHQRNKRCCAGSGLNTEPSHLSDENGDAQQVGGAAVTKCLGTAHAGRKPQVGALHTDHDH